MTRQDYFPARAFPPCSVGRFFVGASDAEKVTPDAHYAMRLEVIAAARGPDLSRLRVYENSASAFVRFGSSTATIA